MTLGQWHELRVSRTGRLAVLQVDKRPPSQVLAPGAFTQLSLPLNLYIGGVPNFDMVSPKVKVRTSFIGCIQKVNVTESVILCIVEGWIQRSKYFVILTRKLKLFCAPCTLGEPNTSTFAISRIFSNLKYHLSLGFSLPMRALLLARVSCS